MASCILAELDDTSPTVFDEDPDEYTVHAAARRMSSHPTQGGGRVWQDFGAPDCDRQIELHTGGMEAATYDALVAKYIQAGKQWKWTDHEGDSYQVVFREPAEHRRLFSSFESTVAPIFRTPEWFRDG